jgi:hypothetical protein
MQPPPQLFPPCVSLFLSLLAWPVLLALLVSG